MPAPVITVVDASDVAISSGNPITLGVVPRGTVGAEFTFWIWNDRGGGVGSDAASPMLVILNTPDSIADLLAGTTINGMQSMIEGKSCNAIRTFADNQILWTPLRPTTPLPMSPIPSNCARQVIVRLNAPPDSDNVTIKHVQFQISY